MEKALNKLKPVRRQRELTVLRSSPGVDRVTVSTSLPVTFVAALEQYVSIVNQKRAEAGKKDKVTRSYVLAAGALQAFPLLKEILDEYDEAYKIQGRSQDEQG